MDTLRAIIPLSNHLHLHLSSFHRIALTNHRTKRTVTREFRICRNQQVAQIHTLLHITMKRMHCIAESIHLLNRVRHKHSLEVIAIFQSMTNTSRNSINILKHCAILHAIYIFAQRSTQIIASHNRRNQTPHLSIKTSNSQIRRTLQRNLLCMARTTQRHNMLLWHSIKLIKIIRNHKIFIRHNTFNRSYNNLTINSATQFLQMRLQKRRRRSEKQNICFRHSNIYFTRKFYSIQIKSNSRKIRWIMPYLLKLSYLVLTTHIPNNLWNILHHYFSNRSGKRTTTHYGYFWVIIFHNQNRFLTIKRATITL